jgi:aryl-alcohol dehydrogenase-like predicted oxidoreductase
MALQNRIRSGDKMNKRKLGQSAIQIAPLAFGGNVFGWTVDVKSLF